MEKRPYRMTARAVTAEQTAERIVDAMLARFAEAPYEQIRLDDVAADAGVTVQTVIRRFGGKPGLMRATVERELGRIVGTRAAASADDPLRTLADLVAHYERYGALILKVYAEAPQVEGLADVVVAGRAYHLGWCRDAFSAHLPGPDASTRKRRLAQLTAICDATTWRILRQDLGLSVPQTRQALVEMAGPLLVLG